MENEITDMGELYTEFLKNEIAKYCTDGAYEMTWDNEDKDVLKRDLPALIEDYNGEDNFISYLTDRVLESFMNNGWYVEDNLYDLIHSDAKQLSNAELSDYIEQKMTSGDFWDDMENNGYKGVDLGLEYILSHMNFAVDIFIATPNELNYDLGSIISAFGSDYIQADINNIDGTYLDNGVSYLVNQQGHSLLELYDDLFGENSDNTFIRSVASEITNNPAEATCCLAVVANVTGEQFAQLISMSKSGTGSVEFSTGTTIGIFNDWVGTGSSFDIQLEKPFDLPASYIFRVKLDDDSSAGAYSIADVYGGDISSENSEVKINSGSTNASLENPDDVLSKVIAKYGNNDLEESYNILTEADNAQLQELVDKCKEAYANNDLESAGKYWSDIYDAVLPDEKTMQTMSDAERMESYSLLSKLMNQFTDREVYDITDYLKRKAYREMGYDY